MSTAKWITLGFGIGFIVAILTAAYVLPHPNQHQHRHDSNWSLMVRALKDGTGTQMPVTVSTAHEIMGKYRNLLTLKNEGPVAESQPEISKPVAEIPEAPNDITTPMAPFKIAELAEVQQQIPVPVEIPIEITKNEEPSILARQSAEEKAPKTEVGITPANLVQNEKQAAQLVETIIVRKFKKPDYIKKLFVQINRDKKNIAGIKRCLSRIVGHRVTDIKLKLWCDNPKVVVKNFGRPCFNLVLALNSQKGEIKFVIDGPVALGRYNWGKNGKSWRLKNAEFAELTKTNLAEAKKFISLADKTFYQYPPGATDIGSNNLNGTTNAATLVCSKGKG